MICEIRTCIFCRKRYSVGPTERKMMADNPRLMPVHDECIDAWKRRPLIKRMELFRSESNAS